ncbi:hypothetical protein NSE01_18170 [Novosphingobium sediminis]|uniref:Peptidase M28 domain-containing protein n=1 Tax=Novosphingobium sediminis TaxID=707214 RepID=A0A512AJW3_9SPHN|nr:M28 family peptidase [Novosphingobium sediminis]GEN99984.1 hypothetical protein NSE01_18170 [Novosphingobium sediminis]
MRLGGWLNRLAFAAAGMLALLGTAAQADEGPKDAATRQWWALTRELSSDAMEGRDTGSPGYDRAAAIVAKRFAEAGLKAAGDGGGWFQTITFEDLRLDEARSRLTVGGQALRFNREVQLSPSAATPKSLTAAATFRGYCSQAEIADVKGQLVVCYGRPAPARLKGFDRLKALQDAGAAGMLLIAAPGLPGEPIRWPFAYSRSVTPLEEVAVARGGAPWLQGVLNPDSLARLTGQADAILKAGAAGADLPRVELGKATGVLTVNRRVTRSANVLGLLPGTDPALADQAIVIAAHLDGYGRGEPVKGDRIYNGTLDDAAYVALLARFAAMHRGKGLKRPVILAVFTGEEKGLWGSRWFVKHPTVPLSRIAAVINLDQVRPLYPLKLLSVHGLKESSLGDLVLQVAKARGIAVQEDPEPERDLLRRSDNWPLMQACVPGTSFVFATYDDASRAKYRDWYERRYHHPADDLSTPIDWQAASDFNGFFTALTEAAADAPGRITWNWGLAPHRAGAVRFTDLEPQYQPGKCELAVLETPKGQRPAAATYLTEAYQAAHAALFAKGAVRIQPKAPAGKIGFTETWVLPPSVADAAIAQAGGDPRKLEALLGLDAGYLGDAPVRVDIPAPQNYRIPSGNEYAANAFWRPGGMTWEGGLPEAVIDPVPPEGYVVTPVFGKAP